MHRRYLINYFGTKKGLMELISNIRTPLVIVHTISILTV
jgi:hypothetical protein